MDNQHFTSIDPVTDPQWRNFVENHPDATIYHTPEWLKTVCETYRYKVRAAVLQRDGKIISGLPLIQVNSKITGNRWVSAAFSDYVEPLRAKNFPEFDFYQKIIDASVAEQNRFVEFRRLSNSVFLPEMQNRQVSNDTSIHLLNIDPNIDDVWSSFHKNHIQRSIKKAQKNNLEIEIGSSDDAVKIFYHLLTLTRRKHGLPPQPFSFYKNMMKHLGETDKLKIIFASSGGKKIAGILLAHFNKKMHYLYSGSNENCLKLRPNHLVIWEAIKLAKDLGCRVFDFGRTASSNTSLMNFKSYWGAEPHSITTYRFYRDDVPEPKNGSESNSFVKDRAQRLLKQAPLPLMQFVGKLIYRHLG